MGDKLCFMHQTKADIHGNFSAQFHLSNKFTYQIYVNDGISITEKTVNGSAYDTDIQLYDEATGTKVSSTNMLNNIKKLKAITEKVIEQERLARSYLGKNALELEDRVYRDYRCFI